MMKEYEDQQGYLQSPVLVGDEDGAGDEGEEVHLEQPVHLVNVLRHEKTEDNAQYILIQIGCWKEQFDRVIGDERKPADAGGDCPRIIIGTEQQTGDKEACKEIIHEPVRAPFDFPAEEVGLRLEGSRGICSKGRSDH